MKRDPEPESWAMDLVGYAGMLGYAAVWVLATPHFAYAQWRRRRRLAAGYFPERYNEP